MSNPGRAGGVPATLIRHRGLTAAGMAATVAAVAGGGLALLQPTPTGQRHDCGLVLCSATLPRSVTATGTGAPRDPGSSRPTPARNTGHSPAGRAALAAGRGGPAGGGISARYRIRPAGPGPVPGQLAVVQRGPAPVTGWPPRGHRGWPGPGHRGWPGPGHRGWPGPGQGGGAGWGSGGGPSHGGWPGWP